MARVKGGTVSKNRRRKVLKEAKGYFGSKHRLFKTAQEQVMHSGKYAFRDRRQNKRNFRKLWITRINAACRENEISYSKFIAGLNKAGIEMNRKMLAELAVSDEKAFANIVKIAKDANDGKVVKAAKAEKKVEVKAETKEETKKATTTKTTAAKKTTTAKKATTAKKTTTKKSAK
jgi:large subunit ribosomal protein L20